MDQSQWACRRSSTHIAEGSKGDVFVGTDPAGISRFDKQGILLLTYRSSSGLAGERINALAMDRQGRLWAVGRGGCFRSRAPVNATTELTFERIDIPGIEAQTSFRDVVADDQGVVWIGTSLALVRFDGNHWNVLTERNGLKSGDVAAISQGQGPLWLAYRDARGITRLRGDGDHFEITHITKQDGLSSDQVFGVAFDSL